MNRKVFYLFCDESGAKGYSDKPGQGIDSLGIVVGIIIHESQLSLLKKYYDKIYKKYATDLNSKFHLSDLPNNKQVNIRNDVFEIIKHIDARLIYSSISKDGMHEWYNIQKKMHDDIVSKEKIRGYGVNFTDPKESMLEMLYVDTISRFFAAIIDFHVSDGNFSAKIFIDNIDTPILDGIKKNVYEVTTYQPHSKEEIISSRFCYASKTVDEKRGFVEFNTKIPDALNADEFNNIDFEIQIDSQYAIFPDVVANSLLFFAKNNLKKSPDISMNSLELISGHPLVDYFVSTSGPDDYDFFRALYSRKRD